MSTNFTIIEKLNNLKSKECFCNTKQKNIFNEYKDGKIDIDYISKSGWNLLFEAVLLGLDNEVTNLINLGININIRDKKGRNALFWAIYFKKYNIIKYLIKKGINTNVMPSLLAMNYAVYVNDVKIIKILNKSGLDINILDQANSTPLIYAVLYNKLHSIDYLLNNGANLRHEDSLGNSALSLAFDLKIECLINKFNKRIKEER